MDLQTLHRLLFFILVCCVPVLVRESGWVEKANFPVSNSWQAAWLRIDARCWLSVGVGGTHDRDRWWHTGVCQLKTAVACMRRNAFLISKACFHLLWRQGRGNSCLVEYIFAFVFTFYMQRLWLHIGVVPAVSEISCKVPIDLMGTSQAFWTIRNSWADENPWLLDEMLFLLNNNISLYR